MLFNSLHFLLVFLPAALLIYRVADEWQPARTWTVLALSLIFYSYWDMRFLPLMILSIVLNWTAARLFARYAKPIIIKGAIICDLLVLAFFKYTNFVLENIAAVSGYDIPPPSILLPLGISFFTFHHIMYLADLRKGRAPQVTLDRYALYICFFPQAIAGPIARWNEVMHQFGKKVFAPGWERRAALGVTFIVIGLLQKIVLADPLGSAIDPIYLQARSLPPEAGGSWLALAFALQIFFDFSGYTDIAIGLGLLFGVSLPPNFDAPFRKASIIELWQSWHMTLARFLRDYVFQPLSRLKIGGGRYRMKRTIAALVITMALCGLWHGAAWHYVIWGTLQGLALVFAAIWRRRLPPLPASVTWFATFAFFVGSGVFFRADSMRTALHVYAGLATLPSALNFPGRNTLVLALFAALLLPSTSKICTWLADRPRQGFAVALGASLVALLLMINGQENYQFVYFQF